MPPSRTALRLAAVVAVLFALWIIGAGLPLLHWIAVAAARLQGAGLAGALLWGAGIYLATLLLVPIIPLILASGWLFGLWGIPISLAAAVASAATSFGIARALQLVLALALLGFRGRQLPLRRPGDLLRARPERLAPRVQGLRLALRARLRLEVLHLQDQLVHLVRHGQSLACARGAQAAP